MHFVLAWVLLVVVGGVGAILITNHFGMPGYAILLGIIIALLSGIFFQLNLMHKDED